MFLALLYCFKVGVDPPLPGKNILIALEEAQKAYNPLKWHKFPFNPH